MTEAKLASYVSRRGVKVSMVPIFPIKRSYDRVIIHLNVENDRNASLVENKRFWPKGVTCRPWLSRGLLWCQSELCQCERRQEIANTDTERFVRNDYLSSNLYDGLNVDVMNVHYKCDKYTLILLLTMYCSETLNLLTWNATGIMSSALHMSDVFK